MTDLSMNLAVQDYLTGLANRFGLYQYYENYNKNEIIHAMYLDIDGFKHVNDIYGHSRGDELLIKTAELIRSRVENITNHTIPADASADTSYQGFVSRIGGDEFVVLLPGSYTQEQVESLAATLLNDMNTMDFRGEIHTLVSLSIGIIFEQPTNSILDDVLAKCDAAMYQAKYDGKNNYKIYRSDDPTLENNRSIELEMENALATGQFQVFLQPKVNMITSKLYGAEALSRWVHPTDGMRQPDMYIPLFEKNGFISKLDMYVFEETCKMKHSWKGRAYEHIPVSVNMSRYHLYNTQFPDTLEAIAEKYEIPTSELDIELTESTFIKDNQEMIKVVDILHQKGFLVSIDDFGSGYSALNLLKNISVDIVKLDKEFLQDSSNNIRGRKVIRSIIGMCLDLKIDVITEGIETTDQLDFIMKCGCQIAQGFFYAKPLAYSEFEKFAEVYATRDEEYYAFRFNGSLMSEDGRAVGHAIEFTPTYVPGIYRDTQALHFEGGPIEKGLVELPSEVVVNESYTISMWIRPAKIAYWTAALYVKFETGFLAILPNSWEGCSDVRIRDSRETNGWYDASALSMQPDHWWHITVVYNSKTETLLTYINGEIAVLLKDIPANRYAKRVMVGGDVFQPSFQGDICELLIYNEAKDINFIKDLHKKYVNSNAFTGGPLKDIF